MKLEQLKEMAAAKTCDKCGKTMAANHYWYKGGWKCKAAKEQPVDANATAPEQAKPAVAAPAKTTLGSTPVAPKPEPQAPAAPVVTQPLSIEVEIIDEARPYLEQELAKINKTAAKVGAKPIDVQVVKSEYRDVQRKQRDEFDDERTITVKQKYLTIKLTGTTPKIQAADGTTWNFVGVITPSAQGKALLKLTPSAEDTPGIRQMYSANPYYCDYCKKIRQRNETFIVNNGTAYRQVGRNCLKDFVGGADPQALLTFFSWFHSPEALQERLFSKSGGGDEEGMGGGGRRGEEYLTPERILATTLAVLEVRGGYVSAKAENGRSTASDVRFAFWGRFSKDMSEQEIAAYKRIRQLADDPAMLTKAQEVITWFKALPKDQIEGNTFFQNVKTMIDEVAVGTKMLGYIVGLYPAWQRAQQAASEQTKAGGPKLVKEWPAEWGEGPKPIENEHATVKFVRGLQGAYGPSQLIMMMLDNGVGLTWKYSGANKVEVGDEFDLTGELQKDTYREPATVKFVPSRKWIRSAFKD